MVKWIIQIDWAGTGFTGANEASRCVDMKTKRGREFYIASRANDIEPMQVWPSTIVMDNSDGRYDPYNTASPLYPNVKPGRKINIKVREVADGEWHEVLTGHIADIQPASGNDNQVIITVSDGAQWLNDQQVDMATILHSTVSGAITTILTKAAYPFGRSIGTWAQPIPVFDAAEYNAAETVNDLANGSLGTFFVAADGTAKYYPLSYNSQPSHSLDQAVLLKEIQVSAPWENVRNTIKVNARRRGQYPLAVIWNAGGATAIPAHGNFVFDATFPTSIGVLHPVWSRDYLANASADGTGTDMTYLCRLYMSKVTSTSAKLTVNNYSGVVIYVTFVQLWGCQLVEIPITFTSSDSGSIASYGPRRFEINNPWLQDSGHARAFSILLKDFLKNPQKNPVIQIQGRQDIQYDMDLMDTIPMTAAKLGIGASFRVGGIEHEWLPDENGKKNGQSVLTTLYLQKIIYSAASIASDPFYPPAVPPVIPPWTPVTPPVPPVPPPDIPPGTIPPGTDPCYVDVNAPANGPFVLPFAPGDLYSVNNPNTGAYYNTILRGTASVNKSTIVINGTFEITADNGATWTPLTDGTELTVQARAMDETVLSTATLVVGSGSMVGTFSPAAATEVFIFRILLPGTDLFYDIVGSPIWSGDLPVIDESGMQMWDYSPGTAEPLVASDIYAVQGKSPTGPWHYDGINPFATSYDIEEGIHYPADLVSVTRSSGQDHDYTNGTHPSVYFEWASYGYIVFDLGGIMPLGTTLTASGSYEIHVYKTTAGVEVELGVCGQLDVWDITGATSVRFNIPSIANGGSDFTINRPASEYWDNGLLLDEDIVMPRTRIYFEASALSDWVRVKDTPGDYANNMGAMVAELYRAESRGNVHVRIDSVLLFNVCPPDAV